ncbi:hypothetical protein P691DRAFT_157652 [Macrolepiota fuliginosa MF-IS2]|uniref:Uncharacterized protein n=1 Tax=Macrolepiota fuliginosa MF-IS2 TaxID=1400762 RepID=A0A9P6C2N1_9AGAR|nr:hypothetical protein P691DRAFT_157652 [Macrolepiota fuliginosa MF-IS2]
MIPNTFVLLSWCHNLQFLSIWLPGAGRSRNFGSTNRELENLKGFAMRCDIDPLPFFSKLAALLLRYFQYGQESNRRRARWIYLSRDQSSRRHTSHTRSLA